MGRFFYFKEVSLETTEFAALLRSIGKGEMEIQQYITSETFALKFNPSWIKANNAGLYKPDDLGYDTFEAKHR